MTNLKIKLDKDVLSKIWEAEQYSNRLCTMTPEELRKHAEKCCNDLAYGTENQRRLELQKESSDIQNTIGKMMLHKTFRDFFKSVSTMPESATLVLQIK